MKGLFRFIGTNRSMGYINGKVYMLMVEEVRSMNGRPSIMRKRKDGPGGEPYCVYDSWDKFLENWERV